MVNSSIKLMNDKGARLLRRSNREAGASMTEYALVIACICLFCIVVVQGMTGQINERMFDASDAIAAAGSGHP
jgi:Flp pilus assembly pilin Flp